ncbi:maleylpyruvate isomerase family mycothiol-dependent enzyme [Pseudonocardia sp. C8]|nr:maleylpyruvate isomerase family mycothiol-dependent enzyme [Pseudonocardia sp. C8]
MRLAATEYGRYLAQLRSLSPEEWAAPTDCPAWDVRQMAAHNLGMAVMAASAPEMVRQNVKAQLRQRKHGGLLIDCLTGLQVEERAGMSPDEIVARYAEAGPRAARGRRSRPAWLRRAPMPDRQVVGGVAERWTWGFLFDTILTRDTWMHRMDTARATGRAPELTAGHDGALVADVVAEWAERHGSPCTLTLTGPAGGRWEFGAGGAELELDAVEFCRVVSRRAPATELLDTEVPF